MRVLQRARRIAKKTGRIGRRLAARMEKRFFRLGWRSPAGLTLPDFLGIGAQKAGTTWLYENLKRHPDIFLPARKELHYFDWGYSRHVHVYARHFANAAGKVKGDITPGYGVIAPDRIDLIRALMPGLKILVLLRNPVERAWSHAIMDLAIGAGRPWEEIGAGEFIAHFERKGSVARGMYTRMLARWEAAFPRDQFCIGFFEDIANDPKQLLVRVLDFLGVTTSVDWGAFPLTQVIRPDAARGGTGAGPVPMPDDCRRFLQELYRDEIERLYARFGAPVSGWRP